MTTKQIMLEFKTVNEKIFALETRMNRIISQLQKDNNEAIDSIVCSMLKEEELTDENASA